MSRFQPTRPFLALVDAAFRLGDRIVFRNTTWTFHRHEHWAIVGPNGSGKSLLADALRGRLPLVQGELRLHFPAPAGWTAESAIGHVSFEDRKGEVRDTVVQSRWNSMEDENGLRVRDFLSYERAMDINPFEVTDPRDQARARFERRLGRAVAQLRLEPFLDHNLISLSNGERQRLQLCRALSQPLRLLILDEPFVGLDAAMRAHFHRVLETLMATQLRVLLLTTRVEDVPRLVTHLLCIDNCQVAAAGRRGPILALPLVKRLLRQGQPRRLQGETGETLRPQPATMPFGDGRRGQVLRPRKSLRPELVRLRDVTVRYGESVLLSGLSWTIRAGESWALLGPNGSGKTTLLSLILGDNPQAYRNDVVVFGRRRGTGESIWDLKRRIGWISPELHLHFDKAATAFEVVASGFHDTVGLFTSPARYQRQIAEHWLSHFGLAGFADTPLFALSAGLQRMVLLARAVVKRPRLLILDEPCQGLDRAHQQLIVHSVDQLIRGGVVTAIYVTHREDEIPGSIKHVLRLASAGR